MAGFKTAYLQHEVDYDIDVVGSANLKVGDLVTVVAETSTVQGYMSKAASLDAATHIIAQSDQSLGYGHIPVEDRDYRYDPSVAPTVSAAPTGKTETWKHVALFKIINKDDVILAADGSDVGV